MIESLSIESGALIVALLSLIATTILNAIFNLKFKWAIFLIIPFLAANALYWSPVMFGADSSEYSTWAAIFIIPWYIGGVLSSLLAAYFQEKLRREDNE